MKPSKPVDAEVFLGLGDQLYLCGSGMSLFFPTGLDVFSSILECQKNAKCFRFSNPISAAFGESHANLASENTASMFTVATFMFAFELLISPVVLGGIGKGMQLLGAATMCVIPNPKMRAMANSVSFKCTHELM